MVKLIEDQIHEFLIQQEEQRCKALEESYAKEGSKKKVERKKIKNLCNTRKQKNTRL